MTFQPTHGVIPYLLLAELGAALFSGSGASADERITLEVIGAVRMAAPQEIRRAYAALERTEVRQAREKTAERSADRALSHRN
ncbi:hypothetical protein VQ02_07935 [Methylobacterium variabile]|jgi:hypothetical protein|uniref:Uncharacterized protein n=1 Tax=Methylobacterium variabile TaxID=298794 RepID=A0A0J6T471_9HYPH|nr:hypothetical protein [Methylobacterium variabile]KMO40388.1 hypothetical protein VQ02_07935 [Methylobacterium variabile]